MWPQIVFGVVLIGLSLSMLRLHRLERVSNASEPISQRAIRTDRSRYQRRMLASALIGLVGVVLLGELFVRQALAQAIFWLVALVVVVILIGLGMVDYFRSRRFADELRVQHQAERAALEAELAAHMKRRADVAARHGDAPEQKS